MRTLHPDLKTFFDSKLQDQLALEPNELLIAAAQACIGVTEVGGDNKGPIVELFQETLTTPWCEPWCLDFLQSCIGYVEAVKGIESPIPATEGVLDLWQKAVAQRTAPGARGLIILWRLGTSFSGHSGIITGGDSLLWSTVEGNTSDSKDIDRNGDGVYAKKRAKGGTRTFTELGFLKCFP